MQRLPALLALATIAVVLLALDLAAAPGSTRQTISLNGDWQFQRDGAPATEWKTVPVPSSFESHEGVEFNGVGWYQCKVPAFDLPPGKRVLLHFTAAATEAQVWWNGEKLGTHLGGWTPFRFDVTEIVRRAPAGQAHEVRVRLDEKVGHNSQGFLPTIAPHFGGIWQDVKLLIVPDTYVDDLRLLAVGDPSKSAFQLEVPLAGTLPAKPPVPTVRYRLRGALIWDTAFTQATYGEGRLLVTASIGIPWRQWAPTAPELYELQISIAGESGDRLETRAAFRTVEVFGSQLRLNGQPLQVRGVLNWGYSAPRTEPNPGEAVWRQEIEAARARGFNLMKFCLWIPPQRYFELADEMGMLVWVEYPTWHPKLTREFLEPLRREFTEFFHNDRNHPSVVLRSLTCETGSGAELAVLQNLYDLAKATIPGAVVEDDSSWIGWNRVNDFWDDHPYGNNDTWVKTLQGFNEHVLAHGLKPLVLGEAIAADTWIDHEAIGVRLGKERPWWAPGPLDEVPRWEERARAIAGPAGVEHLRADSLRYGLLMRKYQIEAFRREVPYGGFCVSVIRDVPICSMGLLNYLGQPKWSAADWAWQGDTMCLLQTDADRRAFPAGGPLRGEVRVSHFGRQPLTNAQLEVTLADISTPGAVIERRTEKIERQNVGTLATQAKLDWGLPAVSSPKQLVLRSVLRSAQGEVRNEWPLWVVPATKAESFSNVLQHPSLAAEAAALFPGAGRFDESATESVVIAARFDDGLARFLEAGGRVLLLPDGQKHSFPLNSHWFLRGAPWVPDSAITPQVPRDLLVELQHFDLASRVVPEIGYLDAIDPILMLWDTHDLKTVKTHGLIFETRAAKGRLLVSAVNHAGEQNAAGRWLLSVLLDHLRSGAAPKHALPEDVWANLKQQLHAEQTNLTTRVWRFHPDPKDEGVAQGWQRVKLASEDGWSDIRVGTAWESQGWPALDGWAWYRLAVDIPARWKDRPIYLSFEGVDDCYELFINGELAGKGGDVATRKDTFNEKRSWDISRWVKPGEPATIAVRVHDWYGAGGIFRPVTLGTTAFGSGVAVLK